MLHVLGNLGTLPLYLLNKSARHHIPKYQTVCRSVMVPGSTSAPMLLGGSFTSVHLPEMSRKFGKITKTCFFLLPCPDPFLIQSNF